ncbi:hypothetical protein Tco_0992458 [Tanacetum coccineum]|uniref:Uncharacterized protein n=1 Tax=Tanacetum coccineum TaxID=301880 RepID=A0ABQ5F2M4_9ASTR
MSYYHPHMISSEGMNTFVPSYYNWEKTRGIQQSPLSILKILKSWDINLSRIYALVLVFLLSIQDDMEHRLEATSKHFKSGVVGSYTNGDDEQQVLDVAR